MTSVIRKTEEVRKVICNTQRAMLAFAAVLLLAPAGILFAQSGGGASPAPPAVEIHGYMQNRIYTGSGANTQFRSERISLSALGRLPEDSNAYVEVYYHPWAPSSGLYLESAYYDRPVDEDNRLRIGKGRRLTFGITPAYPNRKTSNYGIVSETFTQDRIQGIQYYTTKGVFDFGVSLHTGYRLGTRNVGEIPGDSLRNPMHQVPHLALRDLPGELSDEIQLSARIGGRWAGDLTAGISGSFGALDSRDVAALAGTGTSLRPINPFTGVNAVSALIPGNTDDSFSQWGVDIMKKWDNGWVAQAEWYTGTAATLDFDAWNVLGGYFFPNGWKAFVRYSKKNMDTPLTDNPLSWDLNQTSISVVQPIGKSVWLQYEYEINGEDTNTGQSVGNNIFFVELFAGF